MASLSVSSSPSSSLLPWHGLLPREHGAWFQLGLPLATALAVSGASSSGLCLAGAALAGFLAQEPLRVVLGQRGARRAEADGARAWRWGLGLAALASLCLVRGVAGMDAEVRPYLALPLILAAEVLLMAWCRLERSASGTVLAGLALGAWAVPVAAAGGLRVESALGLWGTFGLCFALSSLAVRVLVRAHKPHAPRALLRQAGTATASLALAGAVAWALSRGASPWSVAALLPVGLVALGVCLALPSPRRLPTVGWCLAAASTLTAVLLGVALG